MDSTAAVAVGWKHIAPVLVGSLKNMCFGCSYCRPFVVNVAITAAMPRVRSHCSNGQSPNANTRDLNVRMMQAPVAALHRAHTASILAEV
jgi:hypothetical protein